MYCSDLEIERTNRDTVHNNCDVVYTKNAQNLMDGKEEKQKCLKTIKVSDAEFNIIYKTRTHYWQSLLVMMSCADIVWKTLLER